MVDHVQRFIFEDADVRGEIIHLEDSYLKIMGQQAYPPHVRRRLGEVLAAAVLLSSALKFEGELTIQFQSEESVIDMLVAKCTSQLGIRGLAKWRTELSDTEFDAAFGRGQLVITIQFADSGQYYQSIVPLAQNSVVQGVAQALEHYFEQSEQLATRLWLYADDHQVAGMLLQLMPSAREREQDFWQYALDRAELFLPGSLVDLDNVAMLDQLYPDDDLRIFAERDVMFQCSCSVEKMEQAVMLLGEEEANAILTEEPAIVVRCEFCQYAYSFDSIDVANIFLKHRDQTLH